MSLLRRVGVVPQLLVRRSRVEGRLDLLSIDVGRREEKKPIFLKSLRAYVSVSGQKRLTLHFIWKGWREQEREG